MKHIIFGTSGHIDHGKTSLIKSLTGIDPDRLKEEKLRGMTTDIGFSFFKLQDDITISFIDVPGHEKFLKNMLAGITSVKAVILVISANEGIKPQTIEHFEILKMLDIKYGIIVITKSDLATKNQIESLKDEIKKFVANSFLKNSNIITFSNIYESGKLELIKCIKEISLEIIKNQENEYNTNKNTIFPIDRVFSKHGFGTIVTGTLFSGNINLDQQLILLPSNKKIKVKNIQIHNKSFSQLSQSERAGLTLSNISVGEISRGSCLVSDGLDIETDIVFVNISLLDGIKIKNNQRVRLNFLTNDVIGRIIFLYKADLIENKQSFFVKIKLEQKVFIPFDTTIIIRNYSPLYLIGSAKVLTLFDLKIKDKILFLENIEIKDYLNSIKLLISNKEDLFDIYEYLKLIPFEEREVIKNKLIQDNIILEINKKYYLLEKLKKDTEKIVDLLKNKEQKKVGLTKVELQQYLNLDLSLIDKIILNISNILGKFENMYYIKEEKKKYIDSNPLCKSLYQIIEKNKFQNESDLLEKTKYNNIQLSNLLKMLIHDEQIIEIKNKIYIDKNSWLETVSRVKEFLNKEKEATTSSLRECIGTSRKYMIPILETLDQLKITERKGDVRVIAHYQ